MTSFAAPQTGAITITQAPTATIVHLSGEIDATLRSEASRALRVTLARRLPVVLDTADLTFIDSTGLAFVIQCGATARADGIPVDLPEPPAHVAALLDIVGAGSLFDHARAHCAVAPVRGPVADHPVAAPELDTDVGDRDRTDVPRPGGGGPMT